MTFSRFNPIVLSLLLAGAAALPRAWGLGGGQPAAVPTSSPPPLALHFTRMPLGNVARVLSARFSAPVTLLAGATTPITGDFSGMSLRQALGAVAKQAGLAVVPLGSQDSAGFSIGPPDAAQAAPAADPVPRTDAEIQTDLAIAAHRREQLLRERAALLEVSAKLEQ